MNDVVDTALRVERVISFNMQPWKMREMGYTTTTIMAMETA